MTYVVAWRNKNAVFISADSVLTTEGVNATLNNATSTFEERHIDEGYTVVEERMLKIRSIDNKIIVAMAANDLDLAFEVVRLFELELTRDTNVAIVTHLENSLSMVLNEDNRLDVQLAIGTMIENVPTLISYNSEASGKIRIDEQIVQLGSMVSQKPAFTEMTKVVIGQFIERENTFSGSEEHHLVKINAWIQSFGLNNFLPEIGVGGVICGAQVDSRGVHWQKDSMYALHGGPEFHLTRIQLIIYRKGGVLVYNMSHGSRGFFYNLSPDEIEKIRPELENLDLVEIGKSVDYLVFLSTSQHHATIVTKRANERDDLAPVQAPAEDGSKLGWYLTPKLIDSLCKPQHKFNIKIFD